VYLYFQRFLLLLLYSASLIICCFVNNIMTGLFTTLVIEPVVRHARRFSSQGSAQARPPIARAPVTAAATAAVPVQSHVSGTASDAGAGVTTTTTTAHFSPALGIYGGSRGGADGVEDVLVEESFYSSFEVAAAAYAAEKT
jgi:hypothetical protein